MMFRQPTAIEVAQVAVVRAWAFGVAWLLVGQRLCSCRVRAGACPDCRELVVGMLETLS
jgi:hypothetical protein